ncbi:MAG: hypothetical protein AAGF11_32820 [Myxococcota bacterium]
MMNDKPLHFNGIDAVSGSYLFEPMNSEQLATVAQGKALERQADPGEKDHLAELRFRDASKDEAHFGIKEGLDPAKLEQAGWGVIFAAVRAGSPEAQQQAEIVEALGPLLALRKAQATAVDERLYREYRGKQAYRPGESKQKYLARLGAGPGPADPAKVPYFLLIVGSPQEIPFHLQYQLDVQYAVGRIHFDTAEEYAHYARSVVAAETGGLALSRELAMVGVANPDDPATQLSRQNLVGPLADMAEGWTDIPGWTVRRYFDESANKANISQLLGGPKTPALLFTGSHGMGFPKGHPRQQAHQGALLLQDWPGPQQWKGEVGEDLYFSGDDVGNDAELLGLIAFNFACYGAGTPEYDEFSKQAFKERKAIADRAFVANLPRRLLGHPKGGALATIGHVERAWGCSFMWGTGQRGAQQAELTVFESTLRALMKGMPVGVALEYFNERYAEMASDLSGALEELEWAPDAVDSYTLANMWTSNNDARGYAITGDPAVRLWFWDEGREGGRTRGAIDVSSFGGVSVAGGAASKVAGTVGVEVGEVSEVVSGVALEEAVAPVHFGIGGGSSDDADGQGTQSASVVAELSMWLRKDLEVRTYVSEDVGAAAAAERSTLAQQAELCAFTRMTVEGEVDVVVAKSAEPGDIAVWDRHVAMVERAQRGRRDLLQAALSVESAAARVERVEQMERVERVERVEPVEPVESTES